MEKGQAARAREQVAAMVEDKAGAEGRELALEQDRKVIAYAKPAVKKRSIDRELPVMISHAPSAARQWYENSHLLGTNYRLLLKSCTVVATKRAPSILSVIKIRENRHPK